MTEQQDRELLESLYKAKAIAIEAKKVAYIKQLVNIAMVIVVDLVLILAVLASLAWKFR